MKKYTVILDNGYYMEIMADTVNTVEGGVSFVRKSKVVATVRQPRAVIEDTEPDGYWFRHL